MALTSASTATPASASALLGDPARPRSVPAQDHPFSQTSSVIPHSDGPENAPNLLGLAGRSPAMRRLIQQMRRIAPHLTLATIEGQSGSGCSLTARALHAAGPASQGPFVPCLATQFFSAAGAAGSDNSQGWSEAVVRQARGGMLFLDHVHQLSPEQQESLAGFLQWSANHHAGISGISLPAQIVFSTSVPLLAPDPSIRFRADLASRLCAIRFHLPPLTQRREDIPLLAQIFVQRFARAYGKQVRGLGPGTIAPLLRYPWPGNVRELEETITAAALETESQWIRPIDLPLLTASPRPEMTSSAHETDSAPDFNLDHAIRSHVERVLARTRGNKLRAAQLLGISRSTLYRILAADHSTGQPESASVAAFTAAGL